MKEREYINVSHLRSVRVAEDVLRDIVPKNSTVIQQEDYDRVMTQLRTWGNLLYEEIGRLKT